MADKTYECGQTQALERDIFGTVGVATMLIRADMTIAMVNDAFLRRSGYTKEEVEGRMQLNDFVVPEDRTRLEAYHWKRQAGEPGVPRTYQARCRDRFGQVRDLIIATDFVPGSRETIAFLLDTDELERNLATEQLVRMGKLASGAAHSIRNTLSSVKLRLYSLEHSRLDADQSDDLHAIISGLDYIERAISHYLGFSRPPRLTPEDCSPSALLDQALHLVEQRGLLPGIRIRRPRRKPLPSLMLDRQLFTETLAILLTNACEAMNGGGTLTIVEICGRKTPRAVTLSLSDTGPGVPADLVGKIFDPFFTTKARGTGLGLATARRVVESHGGRLDYLPGKGGCFRITLPL